MPKPAGKAAAAGGVAEQGAHAIFKGPVPATYAVGLVTLEAAFTRKATAGKHRRTSPAVFGAHFQLWPNPANLLNSLRLSANFFR
ncbi:hypothetical protein CA264_19970 [Pontibacter actiniarum]|uniref:Uncharacterized protein n=1 Tax=Pontibacter actiniarum TaxID=323450 RepID=A0A1X9YX45_9BACT|nr:hypothetical protein CA264_19970 [Pontibacter actiniarum]